MGGDAVCPGVIGVDLNVGLFYILAVSSTSVVALLLAGWGSNNKYALLGAFRSVAQLVSYEVPMVLALIVPILLARSMYMQEIVAAQAVPFILVVPLSALIFFISALAKRVVRRLTCWRRSRRLWLASMWNMAA